MTAQARVRGMRVRPGAVGRVFLVWLACALVMLLYWIRAEFGDVSIGQIIFHWRYLGGHSSIDPAVITDFLVFCGAAPLLAAAFLIWLHVRVGRPWLQRRPQTGRHALCSGLLAALPAMVVAASLATFAVRTSALQFLTPIGAADFFEAHYIWPAQIALRVEKPKNLVLVYVESMEASYHAKDVFGRDLLASLSDLHPVSFDSYEQMPGTGFTMAALVSTQCGVPLQLLGFADANTQGELARSFLPRATCLGDILYAHGYHNVFMGGASLAFSGKGKFFRGHHFQEIYGRQEWLAGGIPQARMSGWGVHDDDLFSQAKARLRTLHEAGQPFDLTILTVDTHAPSGYLSPECLAEGSAELGGIVECTGSQVAHLVQFIRTMGYDADTNVVVLGDHLSPPNVLSDKLAHVSQRSIYNAFYASASPEPNRGIINHFDMLPTILDFIGLHPEGGRLGLGYSGFGPASTTPPTPRSRAELAAKVLDPSRSYIALWRPEPGFDAHPGPTVSPASLP